MTATASEVTTLRHYRNMNIIIIIIFFFKLFFLNPRKNEGGKNYEKYKEV